MFSHFRLASSRVQPCSRPISRIAAARSFSSTPLIRSDLAPEPPSGEELLTTAVAEEEAFLGGPKAPAEDQRAPETYNEFMASIGNNFRKADAPNKWLGEQVPFPMNPSFRPPPPVSGNTRTAIYEEYMRDPKTNDVRALSQKYHLSLKRIDAILRLKGMESAWIKGTELQTGFLVGMEKILGVTESIKETMLRTDAHEADILEQDEQRDAARQRYQRLYWESVPEDGREPIVPASLEHAKLTAKRIAKSQEAYKSTSKLMPRLKNTETVKNPRTKLQIVTKPGRPTIKFLDVGGKFIEIDERLRRIAESERRAKIKARKAVKKKTSNLARRTTSS